MKRQQAARPAIGRRAGASALAVLLLGGCSSMPDYANPAQWYRNTVDYFSDDAPAAGSKKDPDSKAAVRADRGTAPPGADKPIPNLGSVPERPRAVAEGPVAQGLVADPSRPRYAPAIRRQGEAVQVLQQAPPEAPPPPPPASITATPTGAPPPAMRPSAPSQVAAVPSAPVPVAPRLTPPPAAGESPEATRARLMTGLPGGPPGPIAPANALSPGGAEPIQTVVISSDGVETMSGPWQPVAIRTPQPAAAAPRPGQPAPAASAAAGGRLTRVATIQFPEGSASLTDRDRYILGQVAKLQRQTGNRVRIVGHASSSTRAADPMQQDIANKQVATQRANAVASELVRLGIGREAVSAAGAGADGAQSNAAGDAANRRAEIYFES